MSEAHENNHETAENKSHSGELMPGAKQVGTAIDKWLAEEAEDSSRGRNEVLDDLSAARQAIEQGQDPKAAGHISRFELWLEAFKHPNLSKQQDDEATGRILFGALMFLSGSYRRQRYVQAANQDDYYERKFHRSDPHAVPPGDYVAERLADHDFGGSLEDIEGNAGRAISTTEATLRLLSERAPGDFGKDESDSVKALASEQRAWLDVLATGLAYAASKRGGNYAAVPVFESKSISEAELTHPFAA
jgi:hypothetical protein